MPLTEGRAPRVVRLGREAAHTLCFDGPLTIFQTMGWQQTLNAQAFPGQAKVRLIGPLAALLDDGGLLAILGHEIGHLLAHHDEEPLTPAFDAWLDVPAGMKARILSAREITADRFGLLACQDLRAVARLEVTSECGDSAREMGTDELAYVEECERELAALSPERRLDDTHPARAFRVFAVAEFAKTDLYARLTGQDPGTLRLRELDSRLAAMFDEATRELDRTPTVPPVRAERPGPKTPTKPKTQTKPKEPPSPGIFETFETLIAGARSALGLDERTPATEPKRNVDAELRALERDFLDDDTERKFRALEEEERRRKG